MARWLLLRLNVLPAPPRPEVNRAEVGGGDS